MKQRTTKTAERKGCTELICCCISNQMLDIILRKGTLCRKLATNFADRLFQAITNVVNFIFKPIRFDSLSVWSWKFGLTCHKSNPEYFQY